MLRRLENIIAFLTVLFLLLVIFDWVFSFIHPHDLLRTADYPSSGHYDGNCHWAGYELLSSSGVLWFEYEGITYNSKPQGAPTRRYPAEDQVAIRTPALRAFPSDDFNRQWLNFVYGGSEVSSPKGTLFIIHIEIPHWPLLLLFALLIAAWTVERFLRSRKAKAGLCPPCPYDLRAHKPSDKCPECGTTIA